MFNIAAAQTSLDELLSDLQVPGSTSEMTNSYTMDGAEDASLIDDLTFAELFTQDAIFAEHDKLQTPHTQPQPHVDESSLQQQNASKNASASEMQAAALAASIFDHQTTAPAAASHRRAPSRNGGLPGPAHTATAVAAAASEVLITPKFADELAFAQQLPGQGQMETPEWDGVIPATFGELEEEMISLIPYRELAKLMARSKLTDRQITEAKKLRRRVKNRQSARVCSTRKRVTTKATEFTNAELHESIAALTSQNQTLMGQHVQLQQQVIAFQKAQQDSVRQKLIMEAELKRMEKMLQDATKGNIVAGVNESANPGGAPIHFPEVESLFAIAA